MTEPQSPFLDPGTLTDRELELVLVETRPGDPAGGIVPEYKFEMRDPNGATMGRLGFRITLTPQLERYGGHIGYDVEPEHRGARLAASSVRLVMQLAARHGIAELLITCAPDNTASRRSIEQVGGRLDRIDRATTEHGVERDTCYYYVPVANGT